MPGSPRSRLLALALLVAAACGSDGKGPEASGDGGASMDGSDGSADGAPSGPAQPFCESFSDALKCLDLSGVSNLDGLPADFGFAQDDGNLAATGSYRATSAFGNAYIADTGALRFTPNAGMVNDDGGYSWSVQPEIAQSSTMVHSFAASFGPSFGERHDIGMKFLMSYATTNAEGWRPSVFLESFTDTRGVYGPAGRQYHYVQLAADAGGYPVISEGGFDVSGVDWYNNNHDFAFVPEIHGGGTAWWAFKVDQAGGNLELYISYAGGVPPFDGSAPYLSLASTTAAGAGPWTEARGGIAYTVTPGGADADTYVDVSLIEISATVPAPPLGYQ